MNSLLILSLQLRLFGLQITGCCLSTILCRTIYHRAQSVIVRGLLIPLFKSVRLNREYLPLLSTNKSTYKDSMRHNTQRLFLAAEARCQAACASSVLQSTTCIEECIAYIPLLYIDKKYQRTFAQSWFVS